MLKRFNFFSAAEAAVHWVEGSGAGKTENALQELPKLTAASGGGSKFLALGDCNGGLSLVNRKFNLTNQVKAHERRVDLVHQLKSKGIVVTVGDGPVPGSKGDSVSTLESVVKFWKVGIDQDFSSTQAGFQREEVATVELIRSFVLGSVLAKEKSKPYWAGDGSKETQFEWPWMTCIDITEDLTQMAIGFSDGHVILIRADPFATAGNALANMINSEIQLVTTGQVTEHQKLTLLQEKGLMYTTLQTFKHVGKNQVTGLGFAEKGDGSMWLWVATEKNLRSYRTNAVVSSGRSSFTKASRLGDVEPGPELDSEGCPLHCCCVAKTPPTKSSLSVPQGPYASLLGGNQNSEERTPGSPSDSRGKRKGQFVLGKADRVEFFSPEDPGSVYAVMGEKKHLAWFKNYLVVVSSGSLSGADVKAPGGVMVDKRDVVQLYDFRSKFIAMSFTFRGDNFGSVEFVARQWNKLLLITSSKRILVMKEKDTQTKLDDLFRRNLYPSAISLASSSGCSDAQIMEIYKMYGDHLYAKGSFDDAIAQYCRTIGHIEPSYVIRRFLDSQRIENLTAYLEALHAHPTVVPSGDHTTLLLNCYTKQKSESKLEAFVRNPNITGAIDVQAAVSVLRASKYYQQALLLAKEHHEHALYLNILMDEVGRHRDALAFLHELQPSRAKLYLAEYGKLLMDELPDETTEAIQELCCAPEKWAHSESNSNRDKLTYDGYHANAEEFIHTFVDHPEHLQKFLRCVVETEDGRHASPLVWNTYLELVLSQTSEKNEADANKRMDAEHLAMSILKNPSAKYDAHQALVLVQSNDFKKGQLFLFERLQMYHMLIRHYMEIGDGPSVLAKCKTHGEKDPNLWVQVLMYFSQEREGSNEREIQEVLHHIERLQILPPLVAIEILAKNPNIPLSTIRPYIMSQLSNAQQLIDEHSSAIKHLRSDTESMKREIQDLRTQPKVFTSTKCNLTGAPLELPTVHFLSGNSYNISSLPGGSAAADAAAVTTARTNGPASSNKHLRDPKCAEEQQSVADIMQKLQQNASTVDEEFFNQLEISPDGFATVAEYFSKCLFEPIPPSGKNNGQFASSKGKTHTGLEGSGFSRTPYTAFDFNAIGNEDEADLSQSALFGKSFTGTGTSQENTTKTAQTSGGNTNPFI